MPIDFPSSPTTNQTYTYLGRVYTYNGSAWDLTYTSANVITSVTNTAPIGSVTNANGNIITISHLNSGVSATTYGGTTTVPVIVVNASGHITSASNAAITAGVSSVGGATGAVSNAQVAAAATAGGISSDESLIYPMLLGGM